MCNKSLSTVAGLACHVLDLILEDVDDLIDDGIFLYAE